MLPEVVATGDRQEPLHAQELPLDLGVLLPGGTAWEVELGCGKGRYLLEQAAGHPERRYLGVEVAAKYYRLVRSRVRRRQLANVLLIRADAVYLLAAALPLEFADAVHVYFPDPWPKARHQKRRLFDAETVDLVLRLLVPGGRLCFASDHLEYAQEVRALLAAQPDLELAELPGVWPEGPRTNYEAKYLREGRPIVRLVATRRGDAAAGLHPFGRRQVVAGWRAQEAGA